MPDPGTNYTITYRPGNYGTGSVQTQAKIAGRAATLKGAIFTREGYTQTAWSTWADGHSWNYNLRGTYSTDANITLYPYWTANTFTVSYNKGSNGTGTNTSDTKTYGVELTLKGAIFTRTGYTQTGWATSDGGAKVYDLGGSYTANAAVTLYPVWAAQESIISSVTSPVPADGSTQGTVNITRYNNAFTHTVVVKLGSRSQTFNNVGTSQSFTIPTSWLDQIPEATSAVATVEVKTYNGSTQIGSGQSKTFTVTVPASVKPTVSLEGTNQSSNATVNSWGILVQGFSMIALSATAAAGQGSSIASIAFSGEGVSQSGTGTTVTSQLLKNAGSKTWNVTVTDKRGRSATATLTRTVYEYFAPGISSLDAFRATSAGASDPAAGTYIAAQGSYAFASCNGHNSATAIIEYKLHTASSWTSGVASATSGTAYTFGGGNISILSTYDVRMTVTDALGNTATYTVNVSSVDGVSFGLNGKCARFGGPIQYADRFECDWDAQFDGTVDVVPRRCHATLSSAGWYRVLTFSIGYSTSIKFASSARIEFCIRSTYSANNNMIHSIVLNGIYQHAYFSDETSYSNTTTPVIDGIRYIYNSTTNYGYVDIHYAINTANSVYVNFDVKYASPEYQKYFTANTLESVADAPSGETVMTTYTFAANTDGDISSMFTSSLGTVKAYRSGRFVTVTFMGTSTSQTWHENDAIMTISDGARPVMSYIDVIGQIAGTVCAVRLKNNGSSVMWVLPSSKTGRLYFSTTYPIA